MTSFSVTNFANPVLFALPKVLFIELNSDWLLIFGQILQRGYLGSPSACIRSVVLLFFNKAKKHLQFHQTGILSVPGKSPIDLLRQKYTGISPVERMYVMRM